MRIDLEHMREGFLAVQAGKKSRHAVEDRIALRHITRVSMLGQLSASIAHQLNQPLTGIRNNAEAARRFIDTGTPDPVVQ